MDIRRLPIAAALLLASTTALANKHSMGTTSGGTAAAPPAPAPVSQPILVEEAYIVEIQRLPLAFLQEAQNDFQNKNLGETASDLDAAARVLRLEETQAKNPDAKTELLRTAANLDQLSNSVRNQEIKSDQQFNNALAQVAYHNAAQSRLQAADAWAKNEYRKAGHQMAEVSDSLRMAAKWSGKEAAKGATATVSGAENVAGKLIAGTGWTVEEVSRAFDTLGIAVQRVGQNVEPRRAPASVPMQPTAPGMAAPQTQQPQAQPPMQPQQQPQAQPQMQPQAQPPVPGQ